MVATESRSEVVDEKAGSALAKMLVAWTRVRVIQQNPSWEQATRSFPVSILHGRAKSIATA